jgi:eukaryotic-like serine/threonine-protein kinase
MLAEGAVIGGDFIVARPLGQGGMGAVYVVAQKSTGKLRALKVMHADMSPDSGMQRRFEQEATVGARIRSAHVVEVVAAGVDAATGLRYLVMELLEGVNLQTQLERTGPLPLGDVYRIFEQLCHGMAAAHAVGVVHRDLKPENIFVATSNQAGVPASVVKILDFGIAKLASEVGSQATAAIGSPLWMAPEQTAPGPVTSAADVWALGLIAYELLTGEHFWHTATPGVTPMQLLQEIVVAPIPPASVRGGARIPPGFDAWFARCVVRDPSARFQGAAEAWEAMQLFAAPPGYVSASARTISISPDALAATSSAEPMAPLAVSRPASLGTSSAAVVDVDRSASAPVTQPSTRNPLKLWAPLGAVLLVASGLIVYRWSPTPSAPPVPAVPAHPTNVSPSDPTSRAAQPTDEPPADDRPTEVTKLPDGFADPEDRVRKGLGGMLSEVQGHRVRLFTRLDSNKGEVADYEVRKAVDWDSWRYLEKGCYGGVFGATKELPSGTVTVAFDILNQLPQHATLVKSTFSNPDLGRAVVRTVSGQSINAAGKKEGHVVYSFKFLVVD